MIQTRVQVRMFYVFNIIRREITWSTLRADKIIYAELEFQEPKRVSDLGEKNRY